MPLSIIIILKISCIIINCDEAIFDNFSYDSLYFYKPNKSKLLCVKLKELYNNGNFFFHSWNLFYNIQNTFLQYQIHIAVVVNNWYF